MDASGDLNGAHQPFRANRFSAQIGSSANKAVQANPAASDMSAFDLIHTLLREAR